jgi:hypothetical protein
MVLSLAIITRLTQSLPRWVSVQFNWKILKCMVLERRQKFNVHQDDSTTSSLNKRKKNGRKKKMG